MNPQQIDGQAPSQTSAQQTTARQTTVRQTTARQTTGAQYPTFHVAMVDTSPFDADPRSNYALLPVVDVEIPRRGRSGRGSRTAAIVLLSLGLTMLLLAITLLNRTVMADRLGIDTDPDAAQQALDEDAPARLETTPELLATIRQAIEDGDFQQAEALLARALSSDPKNELLLEEFRQLELALGEAGPPRRVLDSQTVELPQVSVRTDPDALYAAATQAISAANWSQAIMLLGELHTLDESFQTNAVNRLLVDAYTQAANAIVLSYPKGDLEQAMRYYQNALALAPQGEETKTARETLSVYMAGARELQLNNPRQAANYLTIVNEMDPNYLNGFATVQLYTAYLSLGDQAMQRKDRTSARSFFDSANALPVEDNSAVQRRLASLAGLPLPTRPPVEIAIGPIIEATPTPLPLLVPEAAFTPTPTPAPTVAIPDTLPAELANKIVFLSDRSGYPEVYLMDPVSGAVSLVTEPWVHAVARKTLAVAPDGHREAIVQEDQSRILQIKIYDPEYNATQQITAISDKENESAIAYDPAWSPTGRQIAYVSTESRGDEIYTADLETGIIRRLTDNAWEWDKHPSFSPDGTQIVFYSNRETGRKQLWIMNADGTNQRNLSRNEYNDWDPIWTH